MAAAATGGSSNSSRRDARLRGGGRADAENPLPQERRRIPCGGGASRCNEKVSQTDKAPRGDAHCLRDEVKEMDRTNWLYETQDPQVAMRVKV